jgi:MoaA/NifB/PqqE/SkfB family radical SAM enzyme
MLHSKDQLPSEKFITSDKIFHHLESLSDWHKGRQAFPITLEIHPTDLCNNKCHYCRYEKGPFSLSRRDFQVIMKKLKAIHTKGVILSGGGEPLLNPHTPEFLRLIKESGFDAALITNLTLYKEATFQNILKFTEWCRVSLDTCEKKTYMKIRGVDMFEETVRNVRKLVELKKKLRSSATVGIQMVVCKENLGEILGLIRMTKDLKVDYIQIRPVEILPSEPIPYSKKEYGLIIAQIKKAGPLENKDFKIIFSNKWDIIDPQHKDRSHGFTLCHGYMFIGAIDAKGDYYICCHKAETKDKRFCCGNVLAEDIKEIMSRRKNIIRNLNLKDCYLECRGSNLNRRLEGLLHRGEHKSFL